MRKVVALVLFAVVPYCVSCYVTQVSIRSSPSGANVYLSGSFQLPKAKHFPSVKDLLLGTTPHERSYRLLEGTLTFKKPKYADLTVPVSVDSFRSNLPTSIDVVLDQDKTANMPASFTETMEPTWASVELEQNVSYEKAWAAVIDLLIRQFDLAVISKENGYARTTWLYTWTGKMREDYRVRVTLKFSADQSKVDLKSEANYSFKGRWYVGTDTALLKTLKTDVMGCIGRTTR